MMPRRAPGARTTPGRGDGSQVTALPLLRRGRHDGRSHRAQGGRRAE